MVGGGDDADPSTAHGGGGADTVEVGVSNGASPARVFGDAGDDSVTVAESGGRVDARGGPGADTLTGNDRKDLLVGDAGADLLCGGGDVDTLFGAAGADSVAGEDGDDWLSAGNRSIRREIDGGLTVTGPPASTGTDAASDTLGGGAGNDTLRSRDGAVEGSVEGPDGPPGDDVFRGGSGFDRLFVFDPREGYRITTPGPGQTVIEDIDPSNGDDGRELLTGIERLVFFEPGRVLVDERIDLPARPPEALPVPDDAYPIREDGLGDSRFFFDELLADMRDPDGDRLDIVAASGSAERDVTLDARFDFLDFEPAADVSGRFPFTITVTDGIFEVEIARGLTVTPFDDVPEARDDTLSTTEDAVLRANLLADNGAGPDVDADGDPIAVASVAGAPAGPDPVALPSGARVTVATDGTLSYDPNGAFADLGAGETATDSFDDRLADSTAAPGGVATVEVEIEGGGDGPRVIAATPGPDNQQGGPGDDVIELAGGIDTARGEGGADSFDVLFPQNDEQEVARILDDTPGGGPDGAVIDLNGQKGFLVPVSDTVQVIVPNGDEMDLLIVLGVSDPNDLAFARDPAPGAGVSPPPGLPNDPCDGDADDRTTPCNQACRPHARRGGDRPRRPGCGARRRHPQQRRRLQRDGHGGVLRRRDQHRRRLRRNSHRAGARHRGDGPQPERNRRGRRNRRHRVQLPDHRYFEHAEPVVPRLRGARGLRARAVPPRHSGHLRRRHGGVRLRKPVALHPGGRADRAGDLRDRAVGLFRRRDHHLDGAGRGAGGGAAAAFGAAAGRLARRGRRAARQAPAARVAPAPGRGGAPGGPGTGITRGAGLPPLNRQGGPARRGRVPLRRSPAARRSR